MHQPTALKTLKLKFSGERRLRQGHPWIFSNELENIDRTISPGEICGVLFNSGRSAGVGFFNPHSLIAVRLLNADTLELEDNFVGARLKKAMEYRKSLGVTESGRMFFGESDGLPGLIVDKYGDVLVVETVSAGAELLKDSITKQLCALYKPKGIYYLNTHEFRKLEGLPLYSETAYGEVPEKVLITENGLKYEIPLTSGQPRSFGSEAKADGSTLMPIGDSYAPKGRGQKTGWYFDQRENRAFLAPWFRDRKVLDLYTYLGAFAVTAAAAGAKAVWGVDSSAAAVALAEKNAALNGLKGKALFRKEDAERVLSALENGELPERPDFILLDPPNFVRSRKNLNQAAKLLVKLNSRAMAGLPAGGLLAFSSCSHHISREIFLEILGEAASRARKKAVLLELRAQAKDHPILLNMPETEYLHFALLRLQ
ncbi:MAG: class I SAM-dependent rRNA methyltransferase [Elusimicrobia bacterium]|nr:class I SAM-dependent rRNA methyltransferase [Elusimicrobiota bacterium]